jgi:8-oxo-dGTP pyrophosphatase MutT (NUDIX family)
MANEDSFHLGLKALIQNIEGKVLVLHANLETFKSPEVDHWDLPGGRIHKGETVEAGLSREVLEEVGLEHVQIVKLLDASVSRMRISHLDVGIILFTYLCHIGDQEIKLTDNEHTEFKWVLPADAAKLLSTKFSDSAVEAIKNL